MTLKWGTSQLCCFSFKIRRYILTSLHLSACGQLKPRQEWCNLYTLFFFVCSTNMTCKLWSSGLNKKRINIYKIQVTSIFSIFCFYEEKKYLLHCINKSIYHKTYYLLCCCMNMYHLTEGFNLINREAHQPHANYVL